MVTLVSTKQEIAFSTDIIGRAYLRISQLIVVFDKVCQRSQRRGASVRAEMISMPLIGKPFQRIAMDVVGPLPKSKSGNWFILTICDYATCYPEAVPLPSTEAERVAKELIKLFSRVGIPDEILTDQGSNFMPSLLQETYSLLQIRRIHTSPSHPQTDGFV